MEWNNQRVQELEKLRHLLNKVSWLNSGDLFLEKTQECIELAQQLNTTNLATEVQPNFLRFLEE